MLIWFESPDYVEMKAEGREGGKDLIQRWNLIARRLIEESVEARESWGERKLNSCIERNVQKSNEDTSERWKSWKCRYYRT